MTVEDYELTITRLEDELDTTRQERDALTVTVAEACDGLSGRLDGGDAGDLADAVGQVNRLLEAKDLDADLDEGSVAVQVQRLIVWAHLGSRSYHDLLMVDEHPSRAVVLSRALSSHLDSPLAAEDLYRLTTLPLDGIELDDKIRELLAEVVTIFNTVTE